MGLSIIEEMAESFYSASYRGASPIVLWSQLSTGDRLRIVDAMEAAVRSIPDNIFLKQGSYTVDFDLREMREVLLYDHEKAKKNPLYDR